MICANLKCKYVCVMNKSCIIVLCVPRYCQVFMRWIASCKKRETAEDAWNQLMISLYLNILCMTHEGHKFEEEGQVQLKYSPALKSVYYSQQCIEFARQTHRRQVQITVEEDREHAKCMSIKWTCSSLKWTLSVNLSMSAHRKIDCVLL